MIKSGTRVSNPKGTGGFEFTSSYHPYEYPYSNVYYHVKAYGNQRKPKFGDKIPKWFVDWLIDRHAETYDWNPQPPLDYAPKPIPVIYTYKTDDRVYSIEDDENLYHVQLATLSDGEYFMRNILTTRWLWIAKLYVRLHGWF